MLRKYISDPSYVLEVPSVELREDLSFEMQLVGIMDQRMKVLRNNDIPMVKVLWRNDKVEEMTWEVKVSMRKCYPLLFFD